MKNYYNIMLIAYPLMMVNSVLGMFIRGEGKPQVFMVFNVIGVFSNIGLDYLFVRKMELGVIGAALASLMAISLTTFLMLFFFLRKSEYFKFSRVHYRQEVLRETLLNGSSEFIGQLSLAISMFVYNVVILRVAGINGIAAFTVVGYSSYIFSMVIIGFGQGASPLISFSYGAEDFLLSVRLRKMTNRYVIIVGCLFFVGMQVFARGYADIFVRNEQVRHFIYTGIRIFTFSFIVSGVNVITSFYFTSIGNARDSALISLARGLVVLVSAILVLPYLFGMTGIWLVAPVTEGLTCLLTHVLLIKERHGDFYRQAT